MPQPDHVIRLALPEDQELGEDLEKYFQVCEEKIGFVPNVLRAYTMKPNKLRSFSRHYNEIMLADSGLSKLEREMIAVVVSSANHCYYCLVAHGQAVRQLSGDAQLGEMLAMNYRVADLEPRQRRMLDFAWKLTTAPIDVDEADRQTLRDVGFSDADIFDIADTVGFYNYTNRVAHATEMMPNPDYHGRNR
ncbi:MAG: peroxidase-related enzyme [Caenispirillum bisanense]|nr:peroxidase-related enzyme [Caenispirillum bisanense]MCA1973721.1 peroxidase-related enzyme [Caenispirillum sp.]